MILLSLVITSVFGQKCKEIANSFPEYACTKDSAIGLGHVGEVFLMNDGKKNIVIKKQQNGARASREVKALTHLDKKGVDCVVKLIGTKETDHSIFTQLEFLPGGTLTELISNRLPQSKVLTTFCELAKCVNEVHKAGWVHADLKPLNIMFTDSKKLKLIDFELSIPKGSFQVPRGTPYYADPELKLDQTSQKLNPILFEENRDIWSLGAILGEMVTGKKLFDFESKSSNRSQYTLEKGTWKIFVYLLSGILKKESLKRKSLPWVLNICQLEQSMTNHFVLEEDMNLYTTDKKPILKSYDLIWLSLLVVIGFFIAGISIYISTGRIS